MSVLVAAVFAHPDDEILACGAALARHVDAGDHVEILLLATGLTSRGEADPAALADLQEQARAAARVIGARAVHFGGFPDNAMDSVPLLTVVQKVEAFLRDFPAVRLYTHHAGDVNVDHRVVHQAVITACRPLPGACVREILASEVNSSTEWAPPASLPPFVPTEFMDVSATLSRKVDALRCYRDELRDWPHPRSLEGVDALARWRGTQSGCAAAESFVTVRRLA